MSASVKEEAADVVVIGGGGSALAAACEAAASGASVMLIEKNPKLGGSTAWSVGSVSATGTPHQKRAGIVGDTPDAHFEDLGKFAGELDAIDNHALRRVLVDEIPGTFAWLLESGLVFMGPALEEPHRAPRMHNVLPTSKAYPWHLGRRARGAGVDVRLATRAVGLRQEAGRVVGVDAVDANGEPRLVRARRGVVLASGDYSGSAALKAKYASQAAAQCPAVNVTNTGDGQSMCEALGVKVVNGHLIHGPILRFVSPTDPPLISRVPPWSWVGKAAELSMRFVPAPLIRPVLMGFITTVLGPDPGLFKGGGVLVNQRGERFTDELAKPVSVASDLGAQPDGIGYIVMDSEKARQFGAWPHFVSTAPNVAYAYLPDYRRSRPDLYHEAPTIEALAGKIGADAAALARSMQSAPQPATQPPFIAIGPVKSYVVLTEGGVQVTPRHEVVGADGAPIPGLFAAGSAGQGGLLLYGHGHHLGWAFVSGRRAGRHAAQAPAV